MSDIEEWRAPGVPTPPSPVLSAAIAQLDTAYDALFSLSPTALSDEDLTVLLDAATRLADRGAGAVTAAVGEADRRRLGDSIGARHTGQWWARRSRLTRPEANRLTRLGRLLSDEVYAPVQAGLASGQIHADQASAIVHAVEEIPSSLGELPTTAEAPAVLKGRAIEHLLVLAKAHDAKALRLLGRRILDIAAPEVVEAAEAKALADEEAAADRKVALTLRDDGNGTTTGRFTLPTVAAEMFRRQLMAIVAPTRVSALLNADDSPDHDSRPLHARLGWAFIDWIECYPADRLPSSGGVSVTAVVTLSLATLTGGLEAASLDTGTRISASQARRLACEAGIIPAVLGGRSEILDLGRTRRFHTKAQRVALALRDRGCTADGCDLPPAACHAHHDIRWSDGGLTNVDDGRLLCHRHHRVIHDPRYETTHLPGGKVAFHRRT
ncbi:HNH endonuclease signature motif containing protein [Nocardioides sp.]|uniref:HNH endonuclease signature motif containing protein n=1 Tax=Nocardioides sp. TaxID=35761 RepID=UPI002B761580|nr:DUF222 domain-containing protein [Nocardioides sp.]HXH78544.1 DUF222 domain-containing protein [Nocardioides sp.]